MIITRVKVRRAGEGESAAAWAAALSDGAWQAAARTLKEEGESWVKRATIGVPAREVVVKCRPAWTMGDRLKRLVRCARGDRHWHCAAWLLEHGFATPRPILLADAVVDGVGSEVLVTEYVEGRSVLEHLAAGDLTVREEHEVCRALARVVNGLLERGRYNRDGKPSNLLVVRSAGGIEIATLDTVAIRRTTVGSFSKRVEMLASLVIEAMGVGCAPRRALRARVVREVARLGAFGAEEHGSKARLKERAYELWVHTEWRVRGHGDPTPRVSPLAVSSAPGAGLRLATVPGAEAPGNHRAPEAGEE